MLEDSVSPPSVPLRVMTSLMPFLRMSHDTGFSYCTNPPYNARADASGISVAVAQPAKADGHSELPRRISRR